MRTHYCGQVNESLTGQVVTVAGWVHRRRDHGGVIFVDLRDREGLVQIVCDPDSARPSPSRRAAQRIRRRGDGAGAPRPPGTVNANLTAGEIEVLCQELEMLNRSEPPPFQLDEHVSEEVRLRSATSICAARRCANVAAAPPDHARHAPLSRRAGFIDIETPMLSKATPEGARDYLVPCRMHAGKFFALPQSPQMFKQMLMISGFDRYYQIVKCFRDEDLRADRQPEFTQIDIETSFLDQSQIRALMEGLMRLFSEVLGVELPHPFPRMSYAEAMRRYGSDKPDLRVPLELAEVADLVQGVRFQGVRGPRPTRRPGGGTVRAAGGPLSRKEIDDYTAYVAIYGAKGLAYIKVNDAAKGREGLQSPIVKFLSDRRSAEILQRTGAPTATSSSSAPTREGRQRRAGRAAPQGGPGMKLVAPGGGRCGWSIFRCSSGTRRRSAGRRCIIPFTSPANLDYAAFAARPGEALPRPTTWCSTVGNRRRFGAHSSQELQAVVFDRSAYRRRKRAKFGFCSTRSNTARRRTAASPSAWIGWRC